jgi:hypothetical protein
VLCRTLCSFFLRPLFVFAETEIYIIPQSAMPTFVSSAFFQRCVRLDIGLQAWILASFFHWVTTIKAPLDAHLSEISLIRLYIRVGGLFIVDN